MGKITLLLGISLTVLGVSSNLLIPWFSESTVGFAIMLPIILAGVLILRYNQHRTWTFMWDQAFYTGILVLWVWMLLQQFFHLEQFGMFAMMIPYVDLIEVPAFMTIVTALFMFITLLKEVKKTRPCPPPPPRKSLLDSLGTPGSIIGFLRIDQWLGAFLTSLWIIVLLEVPIFSLQTAMGLISISMLYSFAFAVNQLMDLDTDSRNETKSSLSLASGKMSKQTAKITTLLLVVGIIVTGWFVNIPYFLLSLGFLAVNILYSCPPFRFKAKRVLDLFTIALGLGVFPILLPWVLAQPIGLVPLELILGVMLFNVAAHCFQMLGDIEADSKAGLKTSAVYLGKKWTLRVGIIFFTIGLALLLHYGIVSINLAAGWFKARTILVFLTFGLLASPALDALTSKNKDRTTYRHLDKYTRRMVYFWIALLLLYTVSLNSPNAFIEYIFP
ncbi:MAG: UbiA prenyltransferase family protein [Candidatus Ranarchaeia archaeon]